MFSRILIVDDDDLQRSILKTAFEKKGFFVDTAVDGLEALKMLRTGRYDVGLIDYRIPEIDGLASARLLRDLMDDGARPKLIAVTADSEGLTSRDSSSGAFDAIIPKNTDLPSLFRIVEAHLGSADGVRMSAERTWRGLGLPGVPSASVIPVISREQELALRPFFDLSGRREPDVVLVADVRCEEEAAVVRATAASCRLPFVDLTGHLKTQCDADFSPSDNASWMRTASVAVGFSERRRRISVSATFGPERLLLEYLYVSGRKLYPAAAPEVKACFRYPGFFRSDEVVKFAEQLTAIGFLEKKFVDRINSCARCGSRRMNAREECPSCRSPNVRESVLIHHFKCAYQAPEENFRSDRDLVCPKCRQNLRHYGSDYDKPGHVFKCVDCGKFNADPAVGFSCLDCGNHMDGDAVPKDDVFSYELTEKACGVMEGKVSVAGYAQTLPAPPRALDQEMRKLAVADGKEPSATEIRYRGRDQICSERGATNFERLRRVFIDNLRSILPSSFSIVSDGDQDVVLSSARSPDPSPLMDASVLESCQEHLSADLGPEASHLAEGKE